MKKFVSKLIKLIAKRYIIEAWEAGNENDLLRNPYNCGYDYYKKLQ